MLKTLKIGKSIYLMDNEDKSYRILRRNPDWKKVTFRQSEHDKKLLNGFTRIYTNDKTKILRRKPASSAYRYK
jgi:hypothetical protein